MRARKVSDAQAVRAFDAVLLGGEFGPVGCGHFCVEESVEVGEDVPYLKHVHVLRSCEGEDCRDREEEDGTYGDGPPSLRRAYAEHGQLLGRFGAQEQPEL